MKPNGIKAKAWKLFEKGEKYLCHGDLELALETFRQATERYGEFYLSHHYYAHALLKAGRFDEAFAYQMESIRVNPHFVNGFERIWEADLNPNQLETAIEVCREAFNYNRDLALVHTTLACLMTRQGKLKEAITSFQTANYMQSLKSRPEFTQNSWSNHGSRGPDFFVIGGMKCGTTSLFSYICEHPQIVSPLQKEIHYFNQKHDYGLEWYQAHFPSIEENSGYLTGEATPCLGEFDCWHRIKESHPNVKLIAILRNPIKRAHSHFHHNVEWHGVQHDFESSIEPDLNNKKLRRKSLKDDHSYREMHSYYLLLGLYSCFIKEWLAVFPRNQFLFLTTEELYAKPNDVMRRVFDFLDLEPFQIKKPKRDNAGYYQKYAKLSTPLEQRLYDFYYPFNEQLQELLNIPIDWNKRVTKSNWMNSLIPSAMRRFAG